MTIYYALASSRRTTPRGMPIPNSLEEFLRRFFCISLRASNT